ncbi:MAG TPA: hypothetical protein VLM89_00540 [Phycisphaerae bacterium]|nr:hypothetical protein [Phycisphaerae bacterium]
MSRIKLALLTAGTTLSALALGGCLGGDWYQRVLQYVAIASIFD